MPGTGVILGEVIHADTGNPIEYASISLINKKSNEVVTGQLTDARGVFVFQELKKGYYFIEISFMGLESWKSEEIHITKTSNRNNIGTIQLKSKLLEGTEVNITEKKEIYEFEADKLVYNPDNDIVATTGSAEDVLNRAPMVTVDQDGEVQLRGNSNVNILVDGRKNRIDLANISGSQIEKVEVITSASAKYDPEGMAGIINIVLKKGSSDGFNGNIKLNGNHNKYYSLDKMHGLSTYGNYRKGKFNFFASLAMNNKFGNRGGFRNTITTYTDNDGINPIRIDSIFYNYGTDTERNNINARFGLDYNFMDDITLTNEFKISTRNKNSLTIQEYQAIPESWGEDFPMTETSIGEEGSDGNFDLDYLFELDKEYKDPGKSLNFSFRLDRGDDNEITALLDNQEEQYELIEFIDEEQEIEIDFSYKQSLGNKSKIEFGYDGQLIDNQNSMNFDGATIDQSIAGQIIDNTFLFKRDIHAVFVEYENQLNDYFSIKPSIRLAIVDRDVTFNSSFDGTQYDGILDDVINNASNQTYKLNRAEVYPYFNFTYNMGENQNLQFGFGRRVNRPGGGGNGSWQLMPFPKNIYNENFLFVGNPYLEPEYSEQFDINYSRPIPMGFASINVFYHHISNKHKWYDDDSFENGDILTFKNVSNAYSRGINLFGIIMGQTLGCGYTFTSQKDQDTDNYELNESSERFYVFNRIKFPEEYIKIFDFEFGFYWMKMKLPSGSLFGNQGTIWGDLGISKKFINNKLTVSFTVDNIFDSGGFQMERIKPIEYIPDGYTSGEEFSDVSSERNGRTFKLNFKYQLGKVVDDKKKGFRGGQSDDGGGMMDMGY